MVRRICLTSLLLFFGHFLGKVYMILLALVLGIFFAVALRELRPVCKGPAATTMNQHPLRTNQRDPGPGPYPFGPPITYVHPTPPVLGLK